MQNFVKTGLFLLGGILWLAPVYSEDEIPGDLLSKTWSINHFMTNNEPIVLNNVSNSYSLSFPVSDRVTPVSLELNLKLYYSNKLKANRSQFVVYVNDYYVKQISLNTNNSGQLVKIPIAAEYLINGYNRLTFKVAQHHTDDQCEDWTAPELWTRVDSVKTTISLYFQHKKAATSLARLNTLINDKMGNYSISFLRPESTISDEYLYWGAIAAQGVKLRLNYVSMELNEQFITPYQWHEEPNRAVSNFNIDPVLLKHDAVLFGTKDQLRNLVAPEILAEIKEAYLGLFQQDINKQNFILVVSGLDTQQVNRAVKAFSLMRAPFPDAAHTLIKKINFPIKDALLPGKSIVPGQTYAFSQLGYTSQRMNFGNGKVKFDIRLPEDLYSTEDAMVTLHLNLAYGAAMRQDSVINVSLNGLFNHAIRLKEADGAHYRDYQIVIPLRNFKPGMNTLVFDAVLTPSEYGECTFIQRKNLIATLFQDSLISFPEAGRAVTLPDLQLLGQTGYPFVHAGSSANTYIELLDHSSDTIQTAWHFIAWLATFSQTPLLDIQIGQDRQTGNRGNVVFIGKKHLDPEINTNAPVDVRQWNRFSYPYKETQHKPENSWLRWIEGAIFNKDNLPLTSVIEPEKVELIQSGGLGNQFLLMSYPSDIAIEGVTLALLSEMENSLYSGLTTLFSSGLTKQLQGNFFIWDKQKQFYANREGDTFVLGDNTINLSMMMHFSRHPWQWALIIIITLFLITWVTYVLLVQFKQSVHQQVEEDD